MLQALTIENIAVAKLVSMDFTAGFSALTGATGAGKSLIVDSLGLLAGEKNTRDMIRSGESKASVSGIFSGLESFGEQLAAAGAELDEDGNLQIIRSFTVDGKSVVRINGRAATVAQLREIGGYLLSINGQSDSHALGDRSLYTGYLDEFGGTEEKLSVYRALYEKVQEENRALGKLDGLLREQRMLGDLYRGYLKEIDSAHLTVPDEEEKLEKLRLKLKGIEKIAKYSSLVYRALSQNSKGASAAYLLERAAAALRQLTDVMENAENCARRLDEMRYELEDIAAQTEALLDGADAGDPEKQLTAVESRLDQIARLEKKYGPGIEDVLEYRKQTAAKLETLNNAEIEIKEHTAARDRLTAEAKAIAGEITVMRKAAAEKLTAEMQQTLAFLDMPKVRFYVSVAEAPLSPSGMDSIDLMISANAGEPPMPLDKIASGGEMARVMLALKCALAGKHGVGCIVFDEIDTGVSGGTSEKIGWKLKELSERTQVICVTHSPQVASRADIHYLIEKKERDGRTESAVRILDREGRVTEIARIIGGVSVTDTQRSAAEDLLDH